MKNQARKAFIHWAKSQALNTAFGMSEDELVRWAESHDDIDTAAEALSGTAALQAVRTKVADGTELETRDLHVLLDLIAECNAQKALDALDDNPGSPLHDKLLPYSYD